jgi:peptidyl-prolyl cis-trans isomerase C
LAKDGLTFYQHSKNTKDFILINKVASNLVKDVATSEEKIKKYYDEHKSEFLEPEKVKAKHILFSIKDSNTGKEYDASKIEEIKKKAEEVLAAIKAGASFDEQMNKYTEDPGLKSYPDGYTFSKGEMVKEFEDCAFSLKTGEISSLVKTQYGYHIIKLEEKIPQKQQTLDEVKDSLKNYLDQNEKKQYFNNLLEKLKSESKIVNKMK